MNKRLLEASLALSLAFVASAYSENQLTVSPCTPDSATQDPQLKTCRPIDRVHRIFDFMLSKPKQEWLKELSSLPAHIIELISQEFNGKNIALLMLSDLIDAILAIIEHYPDDIRADLARHKLSLEQFKKDLHIMKGIKGLGQLTMNVRIFSRYTPVMPPNLSKVGYWAMGQNMLSWNK